MIVVLFGVSGAGKTVTGQLLAQDLGWKFYDTDDFHAPANIEKMRSGVPLTDEDRKPWLDSLRRLIERSLAENVNAVLACSALKRAYREYLRVSPEVRFVFLRGEYDLVSRQLQNRTGHFMNPTLLQTQFDTLEEPLPEEETLVIELGPSSGEMVATIEEKLALKAR